MFTEKFLREETDRAEERGNFLAGFKSISYTPIIYLNKQKYVYGMAGNSRLGHWQGQWAALSAIGACVVCSLATTHPNSHFFPWKSKSTL